MHVRRTSCRGPGRVMLVHNPDYAAGHEHFAAGRPAALRPEVEAVVVLLADQPFVDAGDRDGLIGLYEHERARRSFGRATAASRAIRSLWDRSLFDELLAQEGDQGGRARCVRRTRRRSPGWSSGRAAADDVDTPEAYAAWPASRAHPAAELRRAADMRSRADSCPGQLRQARALGGTASRSSATINDRPRPVCPACGFVVWSDPKVAALAVIPWEGGILLGRRRRTRGSGRWSFPSGFVDRGEVAGGGGRPRSRGRRRPGDRLTGWSGSTRAPGKPVVVVAYAAEPRRRAPGRRRPERARASRPISLPRWRSRTTTGSSRDWLALGARQPEAPR